MGNLTLTAFGLIVFGISLGSMGQICMKIGIGHHKIPISINPIETFMNVLAVMMRPYVLLGLLFYVISTFSWILVLSRVRLSVAYPMISMSYILVVVLSSLVLHERIEWKFASLGLLCISIGVTLIGFGMGQSAGK